MGPIMNRTKFMHQMLLSHFSFRRRSLETGGAPSLSLSIVNFSTVFAVKLPIRKLCDSINSMESDSEEIDHSQSRFLFRFSPRKPIDRRLQLISVIDSDRPCPVDFGRLDGLSYGLFAYQLCSDRQSGFRPANLHLNYRHALEQND